AKEVADEIAKVTCMVKKKVGDTGKMFGSVTAQEISDLLKAQGVEVDRRKIQIAEPIKKVGEYKIPVKLHSEVTAEIKLVVEGEQEAAAPAETTPKVEQEGDAKGEAEK
ncbi:MAG: 50S ribosomal protein L9, partial [Nitrospinae bacterium]|nr:50S ribosomal protein L9 [Nitrospinota bacterium]